MAQAANMPRGHSLTTVFARSLRRVLRIFLAIIVFPLVKLTEDAVDDHMLMLAADSGMTVTVDLVTQTCSAKDRTWTFEVDPFRRRCPLEGLDAIGLTFANEALIKAKEVKDAKENTWIAPHVRDLRECPV